MVRLDRFLAKYSPDIAALARAALAKMRARLPGAVEMVYDNYNALVIGFGPNERASDAIFSIVLYPRWVSLFFLQGAGLPDPRRLLKGSGTRGARLTMIFKLRELASQRWRLLNEPKLLGDVVAGAIYADGGKEHAA